MERIEVEDKPAKRMRLAIVGPTMAVMAITLGLAGFAYSQRDQPKEPDPKPPAPQLQFKVDDTSVPTSFANYFRLTNTQEEAVFDFGVSDQPAPQKETSSRISNRIAMNFYTAKRLEGLLKNVTQQVEASYGPLELDIQKRLLPGAKQPSPPTQFKADSGDAPLTYANFCRAQMTPEELILDFGLTTQLTPDPAAPVRMSQRVVMSFVTAKRLSVALQAKIQQVEAAYGPLELDFQKRLLPGAKKN